MGLAQGERAGGCLAVDTQSQGVCRQRCSGCGCLHATGAIPVLPVAPEPECGPFLRPPDKGRKKGGGGGGGGKAAKPKGVSVCTDESISRLVCSFLAILHRIRSSVATSMAAPTVSCLGVLCAARCSTNDQPPILVMILILRFVYGRGHATTLMAAAAAKRAGEDEAAVAQVAAVASALMRSSSSTWRSAQRLSTVATTPYLLPFPPPSLPDFVQLPEGGGGALKTPTPTPYTLHPTRPGGGGGARGGGGFGGGGLVVATSKARRDEIPGPYEPVSLRVSKRFLFLSSLCVSLAQGVKIPGA